MTSGVRLRWRSARRAVGRYGVSPSRVLRGLDGRAVFVVGSPRSGTTFTAGALGRVPGFADLGEVPLLKARIPHLRAAPAAEAAREVRRILDRTQRFGTVAGLRPIEQGPESTFVMPHLGTAYPDARFLLLVRDGRDVASSLIERGWLRDGGPGVAARATGTTADDAGNPYGDYVRFWVEPERAEEFATVSEARRAGWAWRRYTDEALAHAATLGGRRVLVIRYEHLVSRPYDVADEIIEHLDAPDGRAALRAALDGAHARSTSRWRRDLAPAQVADVEAEAGLLLSRLGYRSDP